MKYCADTWFILQVYDQEEKSLRILREAAEGKTFIVIPIISLAEASKKIFQRGVPQQDLDQFLEKILRIEKVKIMYMDITIAKEAARISITYSLPLIDAIVAATGKLADCNALLSGDGDFALVKKKYLPVVSW